MKTKKKNRKKPYTLKCHPKDLLKLDERQQEAMRRLFLWEEYSNKKNWILGVPSSCQ